MREIAGLLEVERLIGRISRDQTGLSLSLSGFQRLRECRLHGEPRDERVISRFDLVIESSRRTPPCCLRLTLRSVRDLSLSNACVGSTTSGLALTDISDRHWDRVSWELHDVESSMIHCYADEAEIVLESQ